MMSWGLKISRNSKQNFKFRFSEEQELNIGSAFLCIPGGVLVVSWGCSWVLNQDLSAQFYFLIAKNPSNFSHFHHSGLPLFGAQLWALGHICPGKIGWAYGHVVEGPPREAETWVLVKTSNVSLVQNQRFSFHANVRLHIALSLTC